MLSGHLWAQDENYMNIILLFIIVIIIVQFRRDALNVASDIHWKRSAVVVLNFIPWRNA